MVSVSTISKEILSKHLGAICSFYAVYYIAAKFLHEFLGLHNFYGTIPFHYQSYATIFTNSTQWSNPVFLGDFISLEWTYLITPFVFLIFLSSRPWDYTITVTAVHCLLVCLVYLAFPLVWEWWVCIIINLLLNILLIELTSALVRKKEAGSFRELLRDWLLK